MTPPPAESSEIPSTLSQAKAVLRAEAAALHVVADRLDERFDQVVSLISQCAGRIAVSGIGKSADVAQKLVGTFNSTGTRSFLLDATRALHGDLGMLHPNDIAIVLSHSGESDEVVRLLGPLRKLITAVIGLTGNSTSSLARFADVSIVYGAIVESDPLALAPSTSSTVMMALGHALAFALSQKRRFTTEDFARYHPAGSLGRKLATVESCMRHGADLRVARENETVRQVFAHSQRQGRRTGAVVLTDDTKRLTGLFTDSDLARLFERRADEFFDRPISEVMTRMPITIRPTARIAEAIDLMRSRKISELPVVDDQGCPIGMLDITDMIGLLPADEQPNGTESNLRIWNRKSA
ncbi:MAG: KpsF/GutQ family sugar-phosphate isomerase [Planctomycetes bacterium]|nr:KpsF/GutQ family sugar-phosphate isomerase [Planctomycetota bacterium]